MDIPDRIKADVMPLIEAASTKIGIGLADAIAGAYVAGAMAAVDQYAWWRDGVQYVGCGATTLDDAKAKWQKILALYPDDKPTTEGNTNG